jgi:hypothetical protein
MDCGHVLPYIPPLTCRRTLNWKVCLSLHWSFLAHYMVSLEIAFVTPSLTTGYPCEDVAHWLIKNAWRVVTATLYVLETYCKWNCIFKNDQHHIEHQFLNTGHYSLQLSHMKITYSTHGKHRKYYQVTWDEK